MSEQNDSLAILWGAEAIAKELGVPPRRGHYLCSKGEIPARKVGGRWCITREALRRFFDEPAPANGGANG